MTVRKSQQGSTSLNIHTTILIAIQKTFDDFFFPGINRVLYANEQTHGQIYLFPESPV